MPTLQTNGTFANRYLLKKLIGVGGYSQVWLAEDTKSGNLEVAIKIFAPGQGLDTKGLELFSKEYALVFNINHPGLLKPTYFDDFEGSPYLVMQYCNRGSVFGKIGEINEQELARFMQQAASALNYLHNQDPPIMHQDIKPDNFLIDNEGNYLMADFGISSKIHRTLTKSMGAQASTGTLAYMPPEKFSADKQIIKAGDIFSLGVTMYEMLTGDLPFGDNGGLTLKAGADIPNLPENFSPGLNQLLISCMAKEPWERPTAERLEEMAGKFLQTGQWINIGSGAHKPNPEPSKEPEQTRAGRKTQPISQQQPQLKPEYQGKPVPEKKRNLTPGIIAALLVLVDIAAAIVWPKGPSIKERIEKLTADSIRIADSTEKEKKNILSNIDIIFVRGGTFTMGCTREQKDDCHDWEKPAHRITLDNFYIGKYEVTQKQWKAVMESNPSEFLGDNNPVENISWIESWGFIDKLNLMTGKHYRMPTEWEYAARSGGSAPTNTRYAGSNIIEEVAWCSGNSKKTTHPVGSKKPNQLGVYDMSGNVCEYCSDWISQDYYKTSPEKNPTGPVEACGIDIGFRSENYTEGGRILRGGGWNDSAEDCRVSDRAHNPPEAKGNYCGLRLVLIQ